ncbi:hypothetical protein FRC03_007535 [Tulasnella sp. 419]|nr:hypothetical protein FRC03_007535 [Tulasnella sp. 419]
MPTRSQQQKLRKNQVQSSDDDVESHKNAASRKASRREPESRLGTPWSRDRTPVQEDVDELEAEPVTDRTNRKRSVHYSRAVEEEDSGAQTVNEEDTGPEHIDNTPPPSSPLPNPRQDRTRRAHQVNEDDDEFDEEEQQDDEEDDEDILDLDNNRNTDILLNKNGLIIKPPGEAGRGQSAKKKGYNLRRAMGFPPELPEQHHLRANREWKERDRLFARYRVSIIFISTCF